MKTKVFVGLDVHKDAVTISVLPEGAGEPTVAKQLSHDRRGLMLRRREEGQPPVVVAQSWKAQQRLHKVFARLSFRKKTARSRFVAVAREIVGSLPNGFAI